MTAELANKTVATTGANIIDDNLLIDHDTSVDGQTIKKRKRTSRYKKQDKANPAEICGLDKSNVTEMEHNGEPIAQETTSCKTSTTSEDNHAEEAVQEEPAVPMEISEIQQMPTDRLIDFASNLNIKLKSSARRSQAVFEVLKYFARSPSTMLLAEGTLDLTNDGYGFLRFPIYHYKQSHEDIYVHTGLIKKFDLRQGDTIRGIIRMPREKEKYLALYRIVEINHIEAKIAKRRVFFDDCVPEPPSERIFLETTPDNLSGRMIDLIAPIGKGQRALIVAPPRSGKTMLLKSIAKSIRINNPEVHLIVLLINERPEEVTDMQRSVDAEVIAATFDEQPEVHTHTAEMVMDKAVRLAETNADVCILLDSITRLARAYNAVQPHSGKVLSGGVDANALHKPKRLFGLARSITGGGSITIIATALAETGSRMDEVIFEEFKGTGNCEIVLNRQMADKRIFPAIEPDRSGTRQEEKLFAPDELEKCIMLRQELSKYALNEKLNLLISRLKSTKSNFEFLISLS